MLLKTKFLLAIVLLSFHGGIKLTGQEALPRHGILWQITGNGLTTPSYLFGTFHEQGGMQILDSIRSFDSIFRSCNQLICEIDLRNSTKLPLKRKSSTPDKYLKPWPAADSTYLNLLTDRQKNILDSAICRDESLKIIRELNIRPSQAVGYVKYAYQKKHRVRQSTGSDRSLKNPFKPGMLDGYLQQQAQKLNMPIVSLDSNEEYQKLNDSIDSFLSPLSYKSEVAYMIDYIQNYPKIDSLQKEFTNKLLSAYLRQDIYQINQQQNEVNRYDHLIIPLIVSPRFMKTQKKMLIDERNKFWMTKIPGLINNNSAFIAVGAGHLGGEKGLINQLQKRNYQVVSVQ